MTADRSTGQPSDAADLVARFVSDAETEPAEVWLPELIRVAEQSGAGVATLRSAATDLAWHARTGRMPLPVLPSEPAPSTTNLVLAWMAGQRLRFDFKFRPLSDAARGWSDRFPSDALVLALAACGALGARQPDGIELVDRAMAAPDADFRSRHACLHGLWAAHHRPEAAERTIALGGSMVASGQADANVWFRLSSAYRQQGVFEQALDCIDEALLLLPEGSNEVNQDYVRERELVLLALQLSRRP